MIFEIYVLLRERASPSRTTSKPLVLSYSFTSPSLSNKKTPVAL